MTGANNASLAVHNNERKAVYYALHHAQVPVDMLSEDDVIHGHHLPPSLQTAEASGTVFRGRLASNLAGVERKLILEALKSCRGNMSMAAKALGISERIMGLRVRKYGIDIWRFRQ
jgi:Nif-specific regulatory protein